MDDITKNFTVVMPKRPRAPEWTPAEKDLLREKWSDDNLSCAAIGELLGKTKNAVIGMSHRMDLPMRGHSPRHKKKEPSEKSSVVSVRKFSSPKTKAPKVAPPLVPLSDSVPIGIMSLKANSCRAIVGKGADGLAVYCGDDCFWDPELGRFKPFCVAHSAIYYNHDIKRRRR